MVLGGDNSVGCGHSCILFPFYLDGHKELKGCTSNSCVHCFWHEKTTVDLFLLPGL